MERTVKVSNQKSDSLTKLKSGPKQRYILLWLTFLSLGAKIAKHEVCVWNNSVTMVTPEL